MRAQEPGNLDNLIETEWDILHDLRKMLSNPSKSSSTEFTQRLVAGITCK